MPRCVLADVRRASPRNICSPIMPFPDIESAVEDAYRTEREMGFLCLTGMRQPVAFFAAQTIVESGDSRLIGRCPPWLVAELYRWLDAYRDDGSLITYSSAGQADHSLIAKRLTELLPPKESLGWPGILHNTERRHASGKVHQYFTHYVSLLNGQEVLHGLHREYSEAGETTETEYRHGVAIGSPRKFDTRGSECPDAPSSSAVGIGLIAGSP